MRTGGAEFVFKKLLSRGAGSKDDAQSSPKVNSQKTIALDIPEIKTANRDALYTAARQFVESTKIGEFEEYTRPFSKQIRSDFENLYPLLVPLFRQAERARNRVRGTALRMRSITLLLFLGYLGAVWVALKNLVVENEIQVIGSVQIIPLVFPFVVAMTAWFVRQNGISKIKDMSSDFGSKFNGNLTLLHSKATFALENVSSDAPAIEGCDERAEQWTFIALWLFDLYGLYDRYVTTASWRVQTSFAYITFFSRAIKWILVALVSFKIAHFISTEAAIPEAVVILFVYVLGLFAWDTGLKKGASNALFAERFIDAVSGRLTTEEIFRNHRNTKVSLLVKQLRDLYFNALKD